MKTKLNTYEKRRQAELRQRERAVIDEFGELSRAMAPHKAGMARLATLAKSIRDRFSDADPYADFEAAGDYYIAVLGPCGLQTSIEDMQEVYDALGHDDFIKHCSMTLAKLQAACSAGRFESLVTKEPTGPRGLTVRGIDGLEAAA